MKKIRAFYYKENYYCFLPGEDLTVEELRASRGGKGIQMNVTRLSRKNCLPPYFVTGQQETVTVRLKPWHMYPVTAYLLSRKEYDARLLKKVEKSEKQIDYSQEISRLHQAVSCRNNTIEQLRNENARLKNELDTYLLFLGKI